jgi:perosamine synthetase
MIPYGQQWIDEDDIEAVRSVLAGDWITTGPKVPEFEDALSRYLGG